MAAPAPAISIVLPCYNAEDSLPGCLDSLLAQSFSDFELIAYDDGSTDGTLAVLHAYAQRDPRIRVEAAKHAGIVVALGQACALARGALIARMDSDDMALPERLRRQVDFLRSHPTVGLCGTQITYTGAGLGPGMRRYESWVNQLLTHDEILRDLYVECPIPHPTFMMRRSAYQEAGGYRDCPWPEDYDLVMRLHALGHQFGKVPAPLLEWQHSPGRLSMNDERYSPAMFRALKRHYLRQDPLYQARPFHQWGAGEVGKVWLKEWEDPKPTAVVDINPRKIGRTIHGTPVIAPDDLPAPGETYTLVAVGAPGARDEIRGWFAQRAYVELRDYRFLA